MEIPSGSARPPTMAQIAVLAATSVPTVSKVLNGGTDVSDATRRRVMEAAHELGYRRKTRTRADADPRSSSGAGSGSGSGERGRGGASVVDVVVSHIGGSWISRVLEGVETEASAYGVDLVLTVARPDGDWIRRLLRRPSLGAIVVLVDTTSTQLSMLTTAGIPVVVIDPHTRPPADVASVRATNWDGGRMAAEHLLALGHRRFGIIGGRRSQLSSSARIDGFSTALREAGFGVAAARLAYCDWDRDRARREATRMLTTASGIAPDAESSSARPTAMFACSDVMALGVYDAAHEAGVSIPDELSVVGFDDVEESAWATPPMTTVQQPIVEMGAAAFRMLHQAHRRGTPPVTTRRSASTPATRIELETRLVPRLSTAAPG